MSVALFALPPTSSVQVSTCSPTSCHTVTPPPSTGAEKLIVEDCHNVLLMAIPDLSFRKADAVALAIGSPPDAPGRLKAGVSQALMDSAYQNGHCFLPMQALINTAVSFLKVPGRIVPANDISNNSTDDESATAGAAPFATTMVPGYTPDRESIVQTIANLEHAGQLHVEALDPTATKELLGVTTQGVPAR